jgi:hypothetical protein
MEIFSPSLLLAIFPYIFMGSFPIVGLVLVTKWVLEDFRRSKRKIAVDTKMKFNQVA